MKIRHVLQIIQNYKEFKVFRSRKYYFELLKKELSLNYNYKIDFIEKFLRLFPAQEFLQFLISNRKNRPLVVRFNTTKKHPRFIISSLAKKKTILYCLKSLYNLVGVVKFTKVKLGATLEYLSGLYTIQGISSILPVICMDIQENEKILDLTAAPGSKTTLISQIMNNTGTVVANDVNKYRIKSLVANVHRLGAENVMIINYNGLVLSKFLRGFDRVLIDVPCTGTGIVSHDNNIKFINIRKIISTMTRLQKRLLISAIDLCDENSKNGGIIVYSSCSILIEENEHVIQYALDKRNVEIVSTGFQFGMPGYKNFDKIRFDTAMDKCKRFFPHIHNIDGFFICKIKKLKKSKS